MAHHNANLLSSDISRRNPQDEYELIQKIGSGTYGDVYKNGGEAIEFSQEFKCQHPFASKMKTLRSGFSNHEHLLAAPTLERRRSNRVSGRVQMPTFGSMCG
uniref:Protein kinase domain-containing protein n=1 Tax=Glossina pallidipes TaxID=7398 RepID=A0A1A9ZCX2_GLOPL